MRDAETIGLIADKAIMLVAGMAVSVIAFRDALRQPEGSFHKMLQLRTLFKIAGPLLILIALVLLVAGLARN